MIILNAPIKTTALKNKKAKVLNNTLAMIQEISPA